jgi:hypothetical protein
MPFPRLIPFALVAVFCQAGALCAAAPAYWTGENVLVNGKLETPDGKDIPTGWEKLVLRLGKGQAEVKADDGGVLLYFTSPEHMDQARIKQTVQLEPGKVYEFSYEYRSELDSSLHADAALLGTGVFLRAWLARPCEQWTKVRGLFFLPPTVPEKGRVIVMLQNRSIPKLWYRDVSLKPTDLKPEALGRLIPELKVHSVTTDDIFIMPGTQAKSAEFLINDIPESELPHFRFEAELWTGTKTRIPCRVAGCRISVPMEQIPAGKSTLISKMFDRADNALLRSAIVTIERVGELPEGLDFGQAIILQTPDGKPFFPIGIYAGVGWNFDIRELVATGFNVIHCYGTGNPTTCREFNPEKFNAKYLANNRKLLDDAKELGVYVMMSVPHQMAEDSAKTLLLPVWQDLYKDHPAVLAWYVDEMRLIRNTPFPLIKKSYDLIKQGDPGGRQWWAYEHPEPELANSMDSIMIGVSSEALVKQIKLKLGPDKGIIHVYGQVDFRNSTASSLDYNQYNFVMPIIWGARGVFYFTYRNLVDPKTNPECAELRPRVLDTVKRFSAIAPAIVAGEPLPEWTESIKTSGNMEYKVFAAKDTAYLFCGVAAGAAGGGSIAATLPAGKTLRDVLNERPLSELKLELAPGQGRIIELR